MKKVSFSLVSILMLIFAFPFYSCSDDDEDVDVSQLAGRWEKIYDEGVVSEGAVYYTFVASDGNSGECTIHVYDYLANKDTIVHQFYAVSDDNRTLLLGEEIYDDNPNATEEYEIRTLNKSRLVLVQKDEPDVVLTFERRVGTN
ncbi:MAG: hypothetical protein ACOYJF_11905 [Prevotella sp.]|jgi:hypothetical protein